MQFRVCSVLNACGRLGGALLVHKGSAILLGIALVTVLPLVRGGPLASAWYSNLGALREQQQARMEVALPCRP